MNLKPYPEYKDSSDFGDVPSHWKIKRIKNLFQVFNGSTPTPNEENWEGNIIWSTPDDLGKLKGDYIIDSSRKITSKGYQSCGTNLVPKGSIIISSRAPIGHMGIADVDLCTNQGCKSLVPVNKLNNEYFYYLLQSNKSNLQSLGQGATFTELSSSNLKSMTIIEPIFEEQNQIAEFLDKKISEIDLTIEKDTRLIELLQEKRTALINHVVTKGLDREAIMKDSGIEWIGEMPEGWEVRKLKHFGKILGGYAFKSTDFTEEGIKAIKITNIQTFNFNWDETFYLPKNFAKTHSDFLVKKGDVIFALTRPIISTGIKVAIFNETEDGLANQRTGIFKILSDDLDLSFLYYSVYSKPFVNDFTSKITETNQPNISPNDIGEIKLILPSKEEQNQIVAYLGKETQKIDKIITKIQTNIHLLEEYKKSLIHHAVTGKVDVRDAV